VSPHWYRWEGEDLLLNLRIQPRASRDEIVGPHGDALKVRITAPPVDGKANSHLIRYLSDLFGVPRHRLELVVGKSGRSKRLRVRAPTRLPAECAISREN